jgi:hypothetical protein
MGRSDENLPQRAVFRINLRLAINQDQPIGNDPL